MYPNIPIKRIFILFKGNAIKPSIDNTPDKIIKRLTIARALRGLSESPKKINPIPKKTSQARISMERRSDGHSNESNGEKDGLEDTI